MKTLAWGLAGLAVLGGGGFVVYKGLPQTQSAPPPGAGVTSAPVETTAPVEAVVAQDPAPVETPDIAPVATPRFDIVRIEADGSALIAGRGLPERVMQLTLDGTVLTEVTPGPDGQFVGFAGIPAASFPRLLEMRWQGPDGEIEVADDAVIVAATLPAEAPQTPLFTAEAPSLPDLTTAEAGPETVPETAPEAPVVPQGSPQVALAPAQPEEPNPVSIAQDLAQAQPEAVAPDVPQALAPRTPVLSGTAQALSPSPLGVVPGVPAAPQVPQSPAPELARAGVATPTVPGTPEIAGGSDGHQIRTPQAPAIAQAPGAPSLARLEQSLPQTPPAPDAPSLDGPQQLAALPGAETPQVGTTISTRPAQPEAPALFRAGSSGVAPLEPKPLPAPKQIAIDSISYSDADDVIVQGRAGSPGRVRLLLDGAPFGAELILAAAGDWRVSLAGVRPGRYQMRVDLVNDTGGVIARTQTPFQRVETQSVSQTSGVKVVTVQPGFTLWAIARDRYGAGIQYVQVFEANRDQIRDPDLIYPGQVFVLPDGAGAVE